MKVKVNDHTDDDETGKRNAIWPFRSSKIVFVKNVILNLFVLIDAEMSVCKSAVL